MTTHDPEQSKVEEITQKCLDAAGYLIFTARLTNQRDSQDLPIIEYDYRRFHFPLEDAKASLKQLRTFVDDELKALAAQDEEPIGGD